MRFKILLFVCLLSQIGNAQDYVLDLHKRTLSVPNRRFYISRVVDARLSKESIGSVMIGLANASRQAVFSEELSTELQRFFIRCIPATAGTEPIILKILQLRVWEQNDGISEKAYAKVQCQFIQQTPDKQYLMLHQAVASVGKGGIDVTGRHDNNLAEVLEQCLNEFAKLDAKQLANTAPKLAAEELETNPEKDGVAFDFAVLNDNQLVTGVYEDFVQFRSNAPGIRQGLALESRPRTSENWQGSHEVRPYLTEADGKRQPVRKAWGFAFQGQAYVRFNGGYYPLRRKGNVFAFDAHVPATYTPAVYTGGLVGGLVGGLIAGAAAADANANSKAEFVIDLPTGRISDVNAYSYNAEPAKVIIYWRTSKKPSEPAKVVLRSKYDTLAAQLSPGSLVELAWTDRRSDVFACIEGQPETCFLILPQRGKPGYLEYLPAESKSAQAKLQIPVDKEAEFYVKQIRYRQEIEAKRGKK